jgi:hypothetical protein
MNREILINHYRTRGESDDSAQAAVRAVQELEDSLGSQGRSLASAGVDVLKDHVASLVAAGTNTRARLLALARYFYLTGGNEIYIYFTSLFGNIGVLEAIHDRIADQEGEATAAAVFAGVDQPPLGAPRQDLTKVARRLMTNLAGRLPRQRGRQLLAGNNHNIPHEDFQEEVALFRLASSLDDYLADLHRRSVEELEQHARSGKIWYEQVITPAVVAFVRANPEIQSAVRRGNKLYVTKIPYDTPRYLAEKDPVRRKYHLCHCPFVREALLGGQAELDPDWCYCSGGFVKYPFDILFDQDLAVELLESPLLGNERCRFAITLPKEYTMMCSEGQET